MTLAAELFIHTVGVREERYEFLNAVLAGVVYLLDESVIVGCGQASPVKGRNQMMKRRGSEVPKLFRDEILNLRLTGL
jgi:hypothetical protein